MPAAVDELISQLSLEEKVSLLAGRDLWCTPPIERLGIPAFKVTDGPNGARGGDMSGSVSAACFPVATALAATWNTALVREVGRALGQEARSKRAHLLLAPTVNLHRSPLAGRNFECFSEDPHLSARMAVAFVSGVQDEGVGCAIKHFVCNDSEFERHTISSEVDERALRELYLLPFEAAVKEARPWAVMAAYNRLNGTYCSEHPDLLTRVLREEWGFEGFVVSDWFGTRSTAAALAAGLDLEMPGPSQWRGPKLLEAVKRGEVAVEQVDACARRVLAAVLAGAKSGTDASLDEQAEDRPEHRMVARRAAVESVVLLRNEGGQLPLDPAKLRRLALIGPLAAAPSLHGGGSSRVAPHYEVTPLQAIAARCGDGVEVVHEPGCAIHKQLPALDARSVHSDGEPGLRVEFFRGSSLEGPPALVRRVRRLDLTWLGGFSDAVDPNDFSVRCSGTYTASRAGTYTFGLTSAGLSRLLLDGELLVDNWTHQERGDAFFGVGSTEVSAEVDLEAGQRVDLEIRFSKEGPIPLAGLHAGAQPPLGEEAFASAVEASREADVAVVMVGLDADWETEGRDRDDMELPGRQNELVERVAAANPNTVVVLNCGSPVSTPWLERVPAALCLWYPGQECGSALADVLFGDADPSGRLPQTWPARLEQNPAHPFYPGKDGQVHYVESIFVGYRYYEAAGAVPRFPFGHGLSYTSFSYGDLEVEAKIGRGQPIDVSIDVTNTGDRAGDEVVQLYVRDVAASRVRPEKELRAFAKLHLEPGETRTATFTLGERDLAFWLHEVRGFVAEPGEFELLAGSSSQDIRATARFDFD
ncbi:MAG: glycoside hydrolase family 3 C-terminal domain-containing protein [Myxococcota bacterium]|nr:glycoside hydrolase family 3 C-terminal domain-containing protein [Myxococcota bacterium]